MDHLVIYLQCGSTNRSVIHLQCGSTDRSVIHLIVTGSTLTRRSIRPAGLDAYIVLGRCLRGSI